MTNKIANFSSPHCHLQSLDTGATLEEFVRREVELGTGSLTCTDHGYLGACRDVYKLARDNKLTPILGIEAYHRDDNCEILTANGISKSAAGDFKEYYKYGHITMHALDQKAYESLIKKVSIADLTAEQHGSEKKPIFTWNDVEEIGGHNVTMTSGCLIGMVSKHLLANRPEIAVAYYKKLRALAKPGNFYVELFSHRCDKNWVSGVFITLEDGQKLKYYMGKKVRTDDIDEITVSDLAKIMAKGKKVGKLRAIKNGHVWSEIEAKEIVACELVQDFIQNECQPWCPDGDVQLGANKFLIQLAKSHGDKIIISDDAHYAFPEDRMIQDARLGAMGDNFRFYGSYHRQTSDEAFAYFQQYMGFSEDEFRAMVDNNQEWASRFKNFELKNSVSLPVSFYPKDTLTHLKTLIDKHGRMDWSNPAMTERLKSEIQLLHGNGTMDLLPYFFLGEEVCSLYEENGLLTGPGRGSAAGLQMAYLLGITHVDPLEYGLSQDRFLTLDRIETGKMPDIDQDLPSRDILIPWLEKRFGPCFAQISTNTLLRLKNSLLDVARATMGEVPYEIKNLSFNLPSPPQGIEDQDFIFGYEGEDGKEVRGLIEENEALKKYTQDYPDQWKIVQKFLGIVRGKSRHASAYIIADKPIDDFIPLMTVGGIRVTQYTAASCEASGALKMDYLNLTTLLYLSDAIKLVQERQPTVLEKAYSISGRRVPKIRVLPHNNVLLDIYKLPPDQNVFRTICEGDTETVFQLNTPSARKWLMEFNYWKDQDQGKKSIDSIEAISAFTALDRPGPLDADVTDGESTRNMLQEYAARSRGMEPYDSIPFMNKALPETDGVMVYQEQLQRIYQDLTGCTGPEANNFRDNISKKRMAKVLAVYPKFIESATPKVGEETAKKIWEQIVTFGQYGFNKSHSTCYSHTAYACAYLKYYFPLEWWCAVLRHVKDKNDISEKFWKHCKNFVDLPDIRYSQSAFSIKDQSIIAPLSMLKGVGKGAHEELSANMPYVDLNDFCQKIASTKKRKATLNPETGKMRAGTSALNAGLVSKLIVSGVMDSLFPTGLDAMSKLEMYQAALAVALGKKKPEKVKTDYMGLNSLGLYQHRKAILPIYSSYLVPHLFNTQMDGVNCKTINLPTYNMEMYSYMPTTAASIGAIAKSMGTRSIWRNAIPFVDSQVLAEMNAGATVPEKGDLKVAVGAYVMGARKFEFKDKKNGGMLVGWEFLLDIDGEVFKFVKWPNRSDRMNHVPADVMEGGIIVAVLSKRKEHSPFTIEAVVMAKEPLKKEKNEK